MSETHEAAPAAAQPSAPALATPQLDTVVGKYIQLRDRLAAMKKSAVDEQSKLVAAMDKCELYFRGVMQTQGLTSLPTKAGTPYLTTKTSVTVAEPGIYWAWVMEDTERSVFLDIKANKTAVVAFKEANDDLPPGLTWREEIAVNVKR